jgi:molybdenum cofactor cytidylyltransferase
MIFALIPGAGKSERMGRPKLSLPLGGSTVLQVVIETVRRAGVEHVLVIVGPHVPELAPLAQAAGSQVLLLPHETPDMRATIKQGLNWIEEQFHPRPDDAWLLIPADHPTLDENVVRQLFQARREHAECSIFVPTFQGKRGHPTLIGWQYASAISLMPPGSGLNAYLRQQTSEIFELAVASRNVLIDLDTPEDYQRLLKNSGR